VLAGFCQLNGAVGGRPSPAFVECLTGFPPGWNERAARIRAFGDAVVPGVAEMIGRASYAAADFTRSENSLRNLATFGATTTRQ